MKIYINPERIRWHEILKRPAFSKTDLYPKVQAVLDEIRSSGDNALNKFTKKFDGVDPGNIKVSDDEINGATQLLSNSLKNAISLAAENINRFHSIQKSETIKIEVSPGVNCWQKPVAIEKVGLYIPGGSAPLFSTVLMLAIPAKIAGCREIILCTPPGIGGRETNIQTWWHSGYWRHGLWNRNST